MWEISSSTSAGVTSCRSKAKEMLGELHLLFIKDISYSTWVTSELLSLVS